MEASNGVRLFKYCPSCKVMQPLRLFTTSGFCNPCRAVREAQRRRSLGIPPKPVFNDPPGMKQCRDCLKVLALDAFFRSKRGYRGVQAHCKPCSTLRVKSSGKGREYAIRSYRKHRSRHRELHRLRQFERRRRKAGTSDGTVPIYTTKAEEVYRTSRCMYCCQPTPESDRTLEHIIPLSRGGRHEMSNIGMACKTCNNIKHVKTPTELYFYLLRICSSGSVPTHLEVLVDVAMSSSVERYPWSVTSNPQTL